MRTLAVVALLAGLGGTLAAQGGAPPAGGQRRFQPLPDHWLTADSLTQLVGITAAQRQAVMEQYNSINAVMKEAAQVRDSVRQAMQAANGGGAGGPPSQEQMQAMRARFEPMQAELDSYFDALRKLLTPEQQAKLDALPRPMVARRMQRPPPPPGQ